MKSDQSRTMPPIRTERGTGLLEVALWMVPITTLFLMGFALAGFYHDFGAMKGISESMLRESWGKPLRLIVTNSGNAIGVAHTDLGAALVRVASQARQEAVSNLFRIDGFSVRACYWVFAVDAVSGRLVGQLEEHCEQSGPYAQRINFTAVIKQRGSRAIGIPLQASPGSGGSAAAYLQRLVLVGAGVSGNFTGLGTFEQGREITFADVSFPRQELTL